MAQMSENDLAKTVEVLSECLTELEYSTARYLVTSHPYTTKADKDAMAAINEIANAEGELVDEINRYVVDLEGVPQLGNPDPDLAAFNYLSFPYILTVLIEAKTRDLERCEEWMNRLSHDPKSSAMVEKVRDLHAEHLKKLQSIYDMKYKPAEPDPEPEEAAAESAES